MRRLAPVRRHGHGSLAAIFALLALVAPSRAHADDDAPEPPEYGGASPANARLLVGLERLAGVAFATVRDERTYGAEHYYPKQALDAVGPWGLGRTPGAHALQAPRIAFDWVTRMTTLGASATIWPSSISRTGGGDIRALDTRTLVVAIAPRFGWLWCERERFCVWAKAGVTLAYQHATQIVVGADPAAGLVTSRGTAQDSLVAIDLEPTLLVGLVPHVALAAQGAIDVPLVASRQLSGASAPTTDPSPWNMGAWLSLYAWF
jgi:hypothetical protein